MSVKWRNAEEPSLPRSVGIIIRPPPSLRNISALMEKIPKNDRERLEDKLGELRDWLFILEGYSGLNEETEYSKSRKLELKKIVDNIVSDPSEKNIEIALSYIKTIRVELTARKPAEVAKDEFHRIAQGKVKNVYTKKRSQYVYYTARGSGILGRIMKLFHRAELREEVAIVSGIKTNLQHEEGKNLALDFKEVAGKERVRKEYTVRTQKAARDFDKHMRTSFVPFPKSLQLGFQFLSGMSAMHKAGYVHGDPKLENALYFDGEEHNCEVKIADFGKARKMDDKGRGTYTGNPRFAPPEGVLSQKGETYSAALVMIRCLEEEFLQKTEKEGKGLGMLLDPAQYKDKSPDKKRRGIEKFLVQDRNCPQLENSHIRGLFKLLFQRIETKVSCSSGVDISHTESTVHRYIDTLIGKLLVEYPEQAEVLGELRNLLYDMTKTDVSLRLTTAQAAEKAQKILDELTHPAKKKS